MKPSDYVAMMRLSTQEHFETIDYMRIPRIVELVDGIEASTNKDTGIPIDKSLFQPFPSDLRYQNYEAGQVLELPIAFTNRDRVARRFRVLPSESPYFDIISPANAAKKVAPGVSLTFIVRFSPDANRDFSDEIVCVTEREKFVVPVRGLGARAILDMPDSITFESCMVKASSVRPILIRNLGSLDGKVSFTTTGPFRAEPSHKVVPAGAAEQLELHFSPQEIGPSEGTLAVYYDTGECCEVTLQGSSANANVRLEKSSLTFDDTYINLTSQRVVKLVNFSRQVAKFSFKAYASLEEEQGVRNDLQSTLRQEEDDDRREFLEILETDPTMEEHVSVLARRHKNMRDDLKRDGHLYQSDIFSIEPIEGEVWPSSVSELSWGGRLSSCDSCCTCRRRTLPSPFDLRWLAKRQLPCTAM
jgi:hydrocephalus-inducing protein